MRLRRRLRDRGWLLTLLTATASLGVVAAMVATRLLMPAETAVIPTETWGWTADGVVVDPSSANSPFHDGDVVVAVDGRAFARWVGDALEPWSASSAAAPG